MTAWRDFVAWQAAGAERDASRPEGLDDAGRLARAIVDDHARDVSSGSGMGLDTPWLVRWLDDPASTRRRVFALSTDGARALNLRALDEIERRYRATMARGG